VQLGEETWHTTRIHHTFRPQCEERLVPRLKAIDVAWEVQIGVTRSLESPPGEIKFGSIDKLRGVKI
jgi:hypothetical protein